MQVLLLDIKSVVSLGNYAHHNGKLEVVLSAMSFIKDM